MGSDLTTDEMAEKFIAQEEESFQLFTAVGQLKRQAETVETEILNLQGSLEQLNKCQNTQNSTGRAMAELDDKLTRAVAQKGKLETEIETIGLEIDEVLKVIQ